jgi:Ca2+-binding EF-hand superfamily protein
MRHIPILLGSAALLLCACADDHHRKPPEAPWHPASAMLTKYVANKDGSLTRAQLEAGLHADFATADKNHTGCLDTDETRSINEQRLAEDQSVASPLVDLTGRGCIDFDQFANTPRSLFQAMDRDGNGVLTTKELNPYAVPDKADAAGDGREHHGHHRASGGDGNGGN